MTIVTNTAAVAAEDDDRSLLNRRVWLAPICLCLVAAFHLYRVTTAGQTPWKGGGFGMFSTFDAENARFVRAWVTTPEGPRPIELPSELEKRVAELRAAPHQVGLDELAQRLAKRTWFDPVVAREQFAAKLQSTTDGQPLDGERWRALRESQTPQSYSPESSTAALIANKPNEQRSGTISCSEVRVELWKFTMPAGTANLQAELLYTALQPVSPKPEASR